MNRIDLKSRCAVVTGGGQGIGRAIVESLLESGAAVAIWDIDVPLAQRTAQELAGNGTVISVETDVSDWPSVESAATETVAILGGIDILVNNAGITGPNDSVADYDVVDWRKVIDVCLTGVFLGCKAVVPIMEKAGYGRIVNIASVAGKEGNPNASAYSAAKAGVIALTKSLGKELAAMDIAVNCVTPAVARTAIFDQMTEAHIEYMLSKIPRGRFAQVHEIAAMVAWLASQENSFTTGAVFDLSGGRATY